MREHTEPVRKPPRRAPKRTCLPVRDRQRTTTSPSPVADGCRPQSMQRTRSATVAAAGATARSHASRCSNAPHHTACRPCLLRHSTAADGARVCGQFLSVAVQLGAKVDTTPARTCVRSDANSRASAGWPLPRRGQLGATCVCCATIVTRLPSARLTSSRWSPQFGPSSCLTLGRTSPTPPMWAICSQVAPSAAVALSRVHVGIGHPRRCDRSTVGGTADGGEVRVEGADTACERGGVGAQDLLSSFGPLAGLEADALTGPSEQLRDRRLTLERGVGNHAMPFCASGTPGCAGSRRPCHVRSGLGRCRRG